MDNGDHCGPKPPSGEREFSLRSRAAMALVAVAIGFPIAGGFWFSSEARRALAARVREGEASTARAIAGQSRQGMDHAVEIARQAVRRPGLISYLESDDIAQQARVLENVRSTGAFRGLALFDRAGRLTAQVGELDAESTALRGVPSPGISPPRPVNGDAVMVVHETVMNPGEVVIGRLVAEVSMEQAVRGVTDLRFGGTGTATLVDKGGQVLITGEPLRRGRMLTSPELVDLVKQDRPAAKRYYGRLVRREEIAAFTPVPDRSWGVLVTQATSEAFAPVNRFSRLIMSGVVILVGIGVVITVLVSRNLAHHERTLREEQERQARANERLSEANQTLRDFVAVTAHDLRGPISSVVGFADTLVGRWPSLPDEEKQEVLAIIARQGHHLTRLVDDLLMVARLEAGALQTMGKAVALRQMIDEALQGQGEAARAVQVECSETLEVVADPNHLQRMLSNYTTNALKYGDQPIEIQAVARNGAVEVRVCDQGPGVPKELVPRLFEKFARGAHPADVEPGTGLGLSIVRGLAKANGGDAWYEPNEPTGSRFSFKLPRAPLATT